LELGLDGLIGVPQQQSQPCVLPLQLPAPDAAGIPLIAHFVDFIHGAVESDVLQTPIAKGVELITF
jgi:hypothetical protein